MNEFRIVEKSPIKNGLVKNRECTDMFCAIIFVICFLGFIGLGIYFAVVGDSRRMSMGVDGDKQVCG